MFVTAFLFSLSLEIEMAEKQELLERKGAQKNGGWKFTHFTSPGSAPELGNSLVRHENVLEEEHKLPVDVRGSKTSVRKLSNNSFVQWRPNAIAVVVSETPCYQRAPASNKCRILIHFPNSQQLGAWLEHHQNEMFKK